MVTYEKQVREFMELPKEEAIASILELIDGVVEEEYQRGVDDQESPEPTPWRELD